MNSCSICHRRFEDAELLQSNDDEYFCKECFKYEYCAVSDKKKLGVTNRCEGDTVMKPKKMFSLVELSALKQEKGAKANSVYTSKRPLQCPHVDCNRYVSIFDLNAHFQHEHIEVPIVQTSLDARNPLLFYPKDTRYGVKQCLILLSVVPPEDSNSSTICSQAEKPVLPITITVLASRIAAAHLAKDHDECMVEDDEDHEFLLSNDKIIIWTSSNINCDYSYTVAVSTVCEDVRVKYYGPVLQLGNSAKKLCKEGHCLILSHYHFLGMSENGLKPLHLDVIIHSED